MRRPRRAPRRAAFHVAAVAGALCLLTGCAPAARGSTAPSPPAGTASRPVPSGSAAVQVPSRLGVLVSDPSLGNGRYTVELVAADGRRIASVQARTPTPPAPSPTPLVSTSDSRVYFLNGDTEVRYLAPDGSTGLAAQVAGGTYVRVGFSVSPDDQRIAVSLLDYGQSPLQLRMYVEDLQSGGHHVEIFSQRNSAVSEWPVGWRDGALVVAIGSTTVQGQPPNPYNAGNAGLPDAYHLVDPATGHRLAAFPSSCNWGPLVAAGLVCVESGKITVHAWDGMVRDFTSGQLSAGPLSPDGMRMALPGISAPSVRIAGAASANTVGEIGIPMGWIDATHLVLAGEGGDTLDGNRILDVVHGTATVVSTARPALSFFGTIPGGLGMADGFSCRLPVGGLAIDWSNPALRHVGFLEFPGDRFVPDDQDAITWDRAANSVHTLRAPVLTGADAEAYDVAARRWVPSLPSLLSSDGSHYAYLAQQDLSLDLVDVGTASDRVLQSANDLSVLGYSPDGIYAARGVQMGPVATGQTLWRIDPSTGGLTEITTTSRQWETIAMGKAWATELNPSDPHPWVQSPVEPAMSVANNELVAMDLTTKSLQTWFYRAGARVEIAGHTQDSKLMIVVANPTVTEIWLLSAPNTGVRVYAGAGVGSPDRFGINTAGLGSIGLTDAHGVWLGTGSSILRYTPDGGLEKVSDKQGQPAGACS